MKDWSGYLTRAEKLLKKGGDDYIASQSCSPEAKAVAKQQARIHLLEAALEIMRCVAADEP